MKSNKIYWSVFIMEYETFEKSILAIKEYHECDEALHSVTDGAICLFEIKAIEKLESAIVDLLEYEFDDKENDWIGYYLYELNFGEDYHDGCITDENGFNVKMKTIFDLYTVLMDNLDGNHEVNNNNKNKNDNKNVNYSENDNGMPKLEDGMYVRFLSDDDVALIMGDKVIYDDGSFDDKSKIVDEIAYEYKVKAIYKFKPVEELLSCFNACTDEYKIWERKE